METGNRELRMRNEEANPVGESTAGSWIFYPFNHMSIYAEYVLVGVRDLCDIKTY